MTTAAAIAVAAPLAVLITPSAATAESSSGTVLPFNQTYRRCDHGIVNALGPTAFGTPYGVMYTTGNRVVADVQIAIARPHTRYDVRLIQMPRPSSAPCWGGDPGVAITALTTDAAGVGAATVQGDIAPGATGAWVFISRPDPFSQHPAEFYTTDLVVEF
ncbi:MAG TPA: hypothetical protein VHI10_17885 [Mycobacterium sp.]|nr:hypothetical protein [Mycobacterium sp.]